MSSVVGGFQNHVSGPYSSILGGCFNCVPTAFSYAGVFGCSVTAVANCAFHANNFVAQNMPVSAGLPGSGVFYIHYVSPGICYVAIS